MRISNFKKFLIVILISVCNLILNCDEIKAAPYTEADGVVLIDGNTGEVLYEKNADVKYEPASITKVMTAIVVLENSNLTDEVTIGENPPLIDGSGIYISTGEVYTVEELLHAMLLESANDCAEALAEHISGSNGEFGKLMTNKAIEIGAVNSTFKNPSGLHEEGHYTTARDMALILKYALGLDDFIRISRTTSYKLINHPNLDGSEKWIYNRNNCYVDWSEYYYSKLYTGKTGWTPEANHTYVAAAKDGDTTLIASFLNAYDKASHYYGVSDFFEWGFENFKSELVVNKNIEVGRYNINKDVSLRLASSKDIYYTLEDTEIADVEIQFDDSEDLSKNTITQGQFIVKGTVLVNGVKYCDIDLISLDSYEYTSFIDEICNYLNITDIADNFYEILVILLLLIVARIIWVHDKKMKKIKRNKKRKRTAKKKNRIHR